MDQMSIEASDRGAVFAELSKRGISAVRVDEGVGKAGNRMTAHKPVAIGVSIAAGLLVFVCATVMWLSIKPQTPFEPKKESPKRPDPIRNVAKPTTKPTPALVQEKPREIEYWEKDTTNGLSEAQVRKWKVMHSKPPCYTNTLSRTEPPPEFAIFKHHSENQIALYLTLEPGTTLVGTPTFGRSFEEDFLQSCEEPILQEEDDTPEQAELRRQMKEVKIELRNRMRDGESLCQIMADTHEEMQRLGLARLEIENIVREQLNEGVASERDANDLLDAANKMLEERGCAPIKDNPLIRFSIKRSVLRGSQKQEQ